MRLDELLDVSFLQELIAGGYVRRQFHPSEPLAILNYTERAAFEAVWNPVTLATRGLIYNTETLEVVARPFPKFFNDTQLDPSWITSRLDESVTVTDKMDGSLGILYRLPSTGETAIATRGSFASDQALHATALLHEKYPDFDPAPGLTPLFEIIYPANRIVLNYYGMDDLVLLGAVSDHGAVWAPTISSTLGWTGPRTHIFQARTLRDALALPPRENAEGIVVRLLRSGELVKIKQEDYIALHRIVTGMNERAVWERLGAGDTIADIQRDLPEEFWEWVDETAIGLLNEVHELRKDIMDEYQRVVASLGDWMSRRDFAMAVQGHEYRAELFLLLDGRSIADVTWKRIKPGPGGAMTQEVK